MAYKKDIRPWLKENGYTWEDMNKFWEECCEVNWKCRMIANSGKTWSDMTMHQIQQLPTLKETTLAQLKAKEEEERRQAEEEKRKKEEAEYYASHFDELMLKKIDNDEPLSEEELSDLRDYSIQSEYGENRRWQRSVHDVIELCGRYFALDWDEGLTELQEDSFFKQPYEVFKTTKIVVEQKDEFVKDKNIEGVSYSDMVIQNKFKDLLNSSSYKYRGTDNGFEIYVK